MSHRTRRRDRARVHSSSFNRPSPTNSSSFAGSSIDRRRGILYWRATHLATAFTDTAFTAWTRLTAVWNGDGGVRSARRSTTRAFPRVTGHQGPEGFRRYPTVLSRVKFTTKNRHAVVTRGGGTHREARPSWRRACGPRWGGQRRRSWRRRWRPFYSLGCVELRRKGAGMMGATGSSAVLSRIRITGSANRGQGLISG